MSIAPTFKKFGSSHSRRISKDNGFDPGAIKLRVMKLTSDSTGDILRASRISDRTLFVEGNGDA
jgi:hypothetical protein